MERIGFDFTFHTFRKILNEIKKRSFVFQTFAEFINDAEQHTVILRHDIDARKNNALVTAELEAGLEIRGTYYFRMVPQSFNPEIIRKIANFGHEIGYHYEDLTFAAQALRKEKPKIRDVEQYNRLLFEKAIGLFEKHLQQFRDIVPISTICMHGSPLSKYDNKKLWAQYNYREYGIIGEPYFDVDFNKVLYLTDTGRKWNGEKVSLRDRVDNGFNYNFETSFDLIDKVAELPDQIMITIHPQRWDNRPWPWLREYVWQNLKNVVKKRLAKPKVES